MSNPQENYNEMGIEYAKRNATSLSNAFYERPAMISLLPQLDGLKVIDAGCGSGVLTELLVEKGGKVIGFDVSEVLVGHTKHKMAENPNCLIRVADFSQPLDFVEDGSIDLVVASLVLHYIEDWKITLEEVTRVLKQDGQFIFSIHHPLVDWKIAEMNDYFNFELIEDIWTLDDKKYKVQFYHRTLTQVFESIKPSGMYVDTVFEPKPDPEGKKIDEEWFNYLDKNPHFLFFILKKQ